MRRIFTLAALFVLAMAVNAQNYRKWDFTSWSQATIDNLKADAAASNTSGWSDIEKAADAGEGKTAPEATANKCFWLTDASMTTLTANGVVIAETEGLQINASYAGNRSLAIAVDYPSTSLGEYAGGQYLWLGGGGKSVACFTIPNVNVGTKITMTVESHKPTDARGVELYVGSIDASHKIGDSFKPKTKETFTWDEWELPEGVADNGGMVDIIVYNTSGCHIYDIEVGNADEKAKIAYLYSGQTDKAYEALQSFTSYEVEAIDVTTDAAKVSATGLRDYSATVVAASVPSDNAVVAQLKEALTWTPILNLNADLYTAWGTGTTDVVNRLVATNVNHRLFTGAEMDENRDGTRNVVVGFDRYTGVYPSGIFATDDTLGISGNKSGAVVGAHIHNAGHNAYLFLAYPNADDVTDGYANFNIVAQNAVKLVVNSKAEVKPLVSPTFQLTYKDMQTSVAIKHSNDKAQIFYTTDGQQPTEQSTPYTEPISISQEGVTVKAVAIAEGYELSEVAEVAVDLKHQVAQPTLDFAQADGQTTVTLASATDGAQLWYNYNAKTDTTQAVKYTQPIVVTDARTITAFATSEGMVTSEPATQLVPLKGANVRIDVVAHMDANSAEYYEKSNKRSSSAGYYFSWANNKGTYSYYDTSSAETVPDSNGNDSIVYTRLNPEEVVDFENGWSIRSRGHVMIWENIKPGLAYGVSSAYNPATAEDVDPNFPLTNYYLNIGEWNTDYPRNGIIYTTVKYAGPFDVVAYVSNGNSGTGPKVVFEVATDTLETSVWTQLGDTAVLNQPQRTYRKLTRSYEGTDEVFVRTRIADGGSKAGYYDIFIAREGEQSQALKQQLEASGIEDVKQQSGSMPAGIYSLNGMRLGHMQRGVNIVRRSDGTIRKVLVK